MRQLSWEPSATSSREFQRAPAAVAGSNVLMAPAFRSLRHVGRFLLRKRARAIELLKRRTLKHALAGIHR
jgi:hypothetical protein